MTARGAVHHLHRHQAHFAGLGGNARRHHGVEERQRHGGANAFQDGAAIEVLTGDEMHSSLLSIRLKADTLLVYPPKGGHYGTATVVDGSAPRPIVNSGLVATPCTNDEIFRLRFSASRMMRRTAHMSFASMRRPSA